MKRGPKPFKQDEFTQDRRLVWSRSQCQARFRKEPWQLSFEDFCKIWNSEILWNQRGKLPDSLVMTRRDYDLPWSVENCCLIRRSTQFKIIAARRVAADYQKFYNEEEVI